MDIPTRIVVLNGPPGAGKDTAATLICDASRYPVSHLKISQPIKDAAHAALESLGYPERGFRDIGKDEPCVLGRSLRDIYIAMSERFLKPLFGADYLGHRLAAHLLAERAAGGRSAGTPAHPMPVVLSDGGFHEEMEPLLSDADFEVMLVRLHRIRHNFERDSRNWLPTDQCYALTLDLHNDGTVEDLRTALMPVFSWLTRGETPLPPNSAFAAALTQ